MSFDVLKPYNNLPYLPPKGNLDDSEILEKTISASRILAELKQAGNLIPNQSVLIRICAR